MVGIDGTDAVEGPNYEGGDYVAQNDGYGPDNSADCSKVTFDTGVSGPGGDVGTAGTEQPYGGCYFSFDPGTYEISVHYVSEDSNYVDMTGPSVTIDVTG